MIRLRARVLALCALGFLPLASQAATIKVTTPFDIVADNDEICSIREAITASVTASGLNRRESTFNAITNIRTALEKELLEIQDDPDNRTYPRLDMLLHLEALMNEADAYDIARWDADIVADLAAFKPKIQAIGTSRGAFDFSTATGDRYPTEDEGLAPGYYTYVDSATPASPVSITDPANTPTATLVYAPGDRAYWDGANWRKYTPAQAIPLGVDAEGVETALDLLRRVEAAGTSEIERLEGLAEIDGCDDGTSFDVILLEEGVYYVNSALEIPIRLSIRGAGRETVIERCTVAADCGGLAPGGQHRLMRILAGATTEIMNMTLRGGHAGTERGGAIFAESPLNMSNVWMTANRAAAGGAIHAEPGATIELENAHFTGNVAVTGNGGAINLLSNGVKLTNVVMGEFVADSSLACTNGNRADQGHGGAIALMTDGNGNIAISGSALIGNCARQGSAIFIGNESASLSIESTTIARNHALVAGTVNLQMPATAVGSFNFNNLTFVENTADAGGAGLVFNRLLPVQLYNSVLAGNRDLSGGLRPDCDFAVGVLSSLDFRRNYYSNTLGGAADACPGARYPSGVPETENFELGAFLLIGDLLNTMDPDVGLYYVPVFPNDVNNSTENRLVNRGAGAQEIHRCAARDQRSNDRASSVDEECDIGAVEYQIGRRHDDVVELLVDERRCVNVIDADLGDALYVPGSLRVLSIERRGYVAVVVSREPAAWAAELALLPTMPANVDTTLDLDTVCDNAADIPYREAILVIPAGGFRGQTNILYGLNWQTAGSTPVTGFVTAIATIETESRGGFTSSSLGALHPLALLVLAGLLALRRHSLRVLAAGWLAALPFAASANENVIYVNSALDEPLVTTPGDGLCTLREALETARNDRANSTAGDCLNGNEGPDVIEFARTFCVSTGGRLVCDSTDTTVVLRGTVTSYGNVTLRCPETPAPVEGQPPPTPQVCTIRRDPADTTPFRLIDSRGSLVVNRMIFENGRTPDRGAGLEGGAIFSIGSLTITDSIFRNNSAVSGGAIYLSGASSGLVVSRSVFEGNGSRAGMEIAGGVPTLPRIADCPVIMHGGSNGLVGSRLAGGGAIATTQSDNHKIAIESSSFIGNCSVAGAGALVLNSRSQVVVANSTFSENISFEGPGAIDVSGAQGNATLRNIAVLQNRSGVSQVREVWDDPLASLQRRALQFGVASVTLTSSIVAANVRESDVTQAANCAPPSASVASLFNVFGDEDGPATPDVGYTCVAGGTTNNRLMFDHEVFNAANPAAGLLSPLVDVKVGDSTLRTYVINDPVASAGILVDAGFNEAGAAAEDNQVDPTFGSTTKCANVDLRGASRASGGRCDIGPFEVLGITAKEDSGNNRGRADRFVVVDVLNNDIFDDISALPERAIKQDCDSTVVLADTPTAGDRTYRFVDSSQGHVCIEVTVPASEYAAGKGSGEIRFLRKGVETDEDLIGRVPASGYVLLYDNQGVLRDEDRMGAIVLTHRVFTVGQVPSNTVEITLAIENIAPQAVRDTVVTSVGETARINVLANDRDPDSSTTAGVRLVTLSGAGCTPVYNDANDLETVSYWQCQFGRVTMDATGVVTWTPANTFNPFSEQISYEITDDDPESPRTAKSTLTFVVSRPTANGGAILGNDDASDLLGLDFLGAPAPLSLIVLMLTAWRRRP